MQKVSKNWRSLLFKYSGFAAPTVCPSGLDSVLATCLSIGTGLSQGECAALGGCLYNGTYCRRSPIPSLDQLSGEWQNTSEAYNQPSVEGFHGGVQTTQNIFAFSQGTFPPLSQGGESAILAVDGAKVNADEARCYPYQVVRTSSIDKIKLTSTLRMGFEQNLVLLQLDVTNLGNATVQRTFSIDLNSAWRLEPGTWPWQTPRPTDSNSSAFSLSAIDNTTLLTIDSQSEASSAISWSFGNKTIRVTQAKSNISFTPAIDAKGAFTLYMAVAVGNASTTDTVKYAKSAVSNFDSVWDETLTSWSERYQSVFTPNNTLFSGSLPVLATEDNDISALWYQSAISILSTMRTNLAFPRVYATVGPNEGTTVVYAWDTSLWAGLLVLLDPDFLKEYVSLFLKQGVYNGYAVDYVSEKLVGPWYSANDLAIFTTMLRYVNMTGDYAYLSAPAGNGSTNLRELEARVSHWLDLRNERYGLADYGGLSNLLEEVVTYTNMVPSLNAANVWMMDQYSALLTTLNTNATGAAMYHTMAANLSNAILSSYAGPGTGYWLTTYPNGNHQAVKHIYDFDTISLYFNSYLNTSIKQDMLSFVHNDLYTGYWMRALSLSDLAANVSMRPDHGSNGAYTSWPALAAAGVSQLGDHTRMMTYLRSFASVLSEGTWAQCYQLIDPLGPKAASAAEAAALKASQSQPVDYSGSYFGPSTGTGPQGLRNRARISLPDQGETYNENNGASFGDVILSYVFGWNPDGKEAVVRDAGSARGNFTGRLVGVRGPGGIMYELEAGASGVEVTRLKSAE